MIVGSFLLLATQKRVSQIQKRRNTWQGILAEIQSVCSRICRYKFLCRNYCVNYNKHVENIYRVIDSLYCMKNWFVNTNSLLLLKIGKLQMLKKCVTYFNDMFLQQRTIVVLKRRYNLLQCHQIWKVMMSPFVDLSLNLHATGWIWMMVIASFLFLTVKIQFLQSCEVIFVFIRWGWRASKEEEQNNKLWGNLDYKQTFV